MREPVFTETIQIALVVRDIEATMRTYVQDYGIGPWDVYEFNPDTVRDMHEDGKPVERSWRFALAQVGQVQWELIQPLDEDSIYARFLAEKGEGLHHVGVAVPSYDATIDELGERGRRVVFGGELAGGVEQRREPCLPALVHVAGVCDAQGQIAPDRWGVGAGDLRHGGAGRQQLEQV